MTLNLDVQFTRDRFSLQVRERLPLSGVTALYGPSGGGKTTLLRVIAGFERAAGSVGFGDWVWASDSHWVPPHERGVGFMFQDARLFTHLDVASNLAFADRRSAPGTQSDYSLVDVIDAFALEELLERAPRELSGGEAQRVALARTLLSRPRLMLLDEPLAGLDQERKAEILPYLDTLIRRFEIPTLYVSHDVDEVARFADHMLVLGGGQVRGFGSTAEILERLDLDAVTGRFEASTLIEGVVRDTDANYQLVHVALSAGSGAQELVLPWLQADQLAVGEKIAVRIRTRDVSIARGGLPPSGLSIRNVLRAELLELQPTLGTPFVELLLLVDGQRVRARITRAAVAELGLTIGDSVFVLIKSVTFEPRIS